MRFDDDRSVDMVDPQFVRKDLRRLEAHTIRESFDAVGEIISVINDGKEATVYVCRLRDGALAAAKLYRARKFRAFSNAKDYVDTRGIRNKRAAKAIRQGSSKGKRLGHLMWVDREWQALNRLFELGASVPEPLVRAEIGILMEYIGDEDTAAPLLVQAGLDEATASTAWSACLEDVEALLALNLIHGDLSGYNVLWWQGKPRLIDLPQAMDFRTLGNAFELLHRDIANLARTFQSAGLTIDPIDVATRLAKEYL